MVYIYVSLCCTVIINSIVNQLYFNKIKIKKKERKDKIKEDRGKNWGERMIYTVIKNTFGIFFSNFNFIGVELIYNAVLVSGALQSDSGIHINIFIIFQVLFPYKLLQNTEHSSLSYSRSLLVIFL